MTVGLSLLAPPVAIFLTPALTGFMLATLLPTAAPACYYGRMGKTRGLVNILYSVLGVTIGLAISIGSLYLLVHTHPELGGAFYVSTAKYSAMKNLVTQTGTATDHALWTLFAHAYASPIFHIKIWKALLSGLFDADGSRANLGVIMQTLALFGLGWGVLWVSFAHGCRHLRWSISFALNSRACRGRVAPC